MPSIDLATRPAVVVKRAAAVSRTEALYTRFVYMTSWQKWLFAVSWVGLKPRSSGL